jgi:hypothetical protein
MYQIIRISWAQLTKAEISMVEVILGHQGVGVIFKYNLEYIIYTYNVIHTYNAIFKTYKRIVS